jgi:hypothetical protein
MHAWARTGRIAAVVAAVALLAQTLLFLADGLELLAAQPVFTETAAGRDADLATYFVAFFERQHDIAWSIALRDVLGPIGYVAVIVLARAFRQTVGRDSPRVDLTAVLVQVGALLGMLADLVYLSQLGYWRGGGYILEPFFDITAVGRAAETVTHVSDYVGFAAQLVFAVAFVVLGGLCATSVFPRPRLRLLAYAEALALLGYVVAALGTSDVAFLVVAVLLGVVLTPVVVILFGRALPTTEPSPAPRVPAP